MWTLFKLLTEHVTILLLFYDLGGGVAAKRQPGIKSTPPALEGEILITGPPGKSLSLFFFNYLNFPFSCNKYLQFHILETKRQKARLEKTKLSDLKTPR